MKKEILFLLISVFSISLSGQEVEVKGIYATSSLHEFKNSFGCGIGYNGFVKPKSRVGIFIEDLYNCFPYEYRRFSDSNPAYFMDRVRPNNHKIAAKISCSFRILNKSKSLLFIGPELGLILFIINEKYKEAEETSMGLVTNGYQYSNYSVKPAASVGFLLEYELKEIIAHKISVSVSLHPELSGFGRIGMKGSPDPALAGWLNAEFGFNYNFLKKVNDK